MSDEPKPHDEEAISADQIAEDDPHKVEKLANIGKDSDPAEEAEEE